MADRINSLSTVDRISKTDALRGYTKKEVKTKTKNNEKAIEEHAELAAYLSKHPNSEHLTFGQLLEKYAEGPKPEKENPEEDGYILSVNIK